MQTFTQALIHHVLAGAVDREVAANAATHRHDFLVALARAEKHKRATRRPPPPGPAAAAAPTEQLDTGGLRIVPAG